MNNTTMLASALLAAASAALGADYYVSPGNAGAQAPYATWETAAATIEDAMALAVLDKGCTVTLDDGVYGLAEMLCVTNTMMLTSRNGRAHTFVEPGLNFPANTRLCLVRAPTKTVADRPVVSGITFRNATITSGYGAGIHVSFPGGIVQDCRVTGCKMFASSAATPNGAISGSYATFIYRCIIDNNEARWENPDAQNNANAGVAGITFINNENGATTGQGGPVVENCLIVHNYGPAVSFGNITYANPVFRNCTVVDNGGGASLYHARGGNYVNCIFVCATTLPQKRGDGISTGSNLSYATTYSHCYYNSASGSYAAGKVTWTDNIVGFDPKFVNPRAMDYRLRADSPCRSAGAAWNGTGTTDLAGDTIPAATPDIGCYQFDPAYEPEVSVLYVATTGNDANDGSDEAHAFATIPAAYAASSDGDEIRVGPGTYTLDARLTLNKKVALVGAGIDQSFITTSGAFRPVSLENDFALVSGFTFADIPYDGPQLWNGGVLENCRVTRCKRTDAASSTVYVRYGCVNRCVIDSNTNTHTTASYAVHLTSIHPVKTVIQPAGFLVNSLVFGNYSKNTSLSSAVYVSRLETSNYGKMFNCTIACNAMAYAIYRPNANYGTEVVNCVLRDKDNGDSKCWYDPASTPPSTMWRNNCTPVEIGAGCVTDNPCFKNVAKGNFHLLRTSPCVGAAAPVGWLRDSLDLDGNPRVRKDGTQDIGCYQLLPPAATTISVR